TEKFVRLRLLVFVRAPLDHIRLHRLSVTELPQQLLNSQPEDGYLRVLLTPRGLLKEIVRLLQLTHQFHNEVAIAVASEVEIEPVLLHDVLDVLPQRTGRSHAL